jgi:hypothetical protein
MGWIPTSCLLAASMLGVGQAEVKPAPEAEKSPPPSAALARPQAAPSSPVIDPNTPHYSDAPYVLEETSPCDSCCDYEARGLFESDHAFPTFIGPISNPVLAKDPRSLTEARFLFIHNEIPTEHPFAGGNFQVYALQVRVALTERLALIADKDGYIALNPDGAENTNGWLNLAAGLKYTLLRDVEHQRLAAAGFMYEPQSGDSDVFQGQGDGLFTVFGTFGQQIGDCNHFLANLGYQFPVDTAENSSFYYVSLHLDRQLFGWVYPLVELNWFHWVQGGRRGLPSALGEGDGLINLGTTSVAGNDLVTTAVGLKARVSRNLDLGAAWEFPISNREDLIDNRVTFEAILRY